MNIRVLQNATKVEIDNNFHRSQKALVEVKVKKNNLVKLFAFFQLHHFQITF